MKEIEIKNIGPIKEAKIDLKSINVFMGKQSSGKSTIAKLISYCTWVEKDVAINQSFDEYLVKDIFKKKLEQFHCLDGYFNKTSELLYTGNIIKIQFKNNKCKIKWTGKESRYDYKRSKIEYIPSERNLITLPFIQKVEMPDNNNRNFLFDWLTIRAQYRKENAIKILDLPVKYYFDKNKGTNHIISENNEYDILLENASSGLQSLTPLILAIEYMTKWVYENEEDISFEKREKIVFAYNSLLDDIVFPEYRKQNFSEIELGKKINELGNLIRSKDPKTLPILDKLRKAVDGIINTHNTQLIIEEPEQNLFPSTQRDLVYHLLSSLNFDRGDRITITTHSPYILYALNNCIMAGLVYEKMRPEDQNILKCKESKIDPLTVSIYEIIDGTLESIQRENGLIKNNYFDQQMKELMDDFYVMLNYY